MDKRDKIENIFITTPIYYVNSEPHLGGVYTTLMADILCRFNKLCDRDTWYLTGTDEHGQKIQQSAKKAGKNEQEFVDEIARVFVDMAGYMKCEYNDFIRTTEPRHKRFVQDIWRKLVKNGWIYRSKYSGWYCVSDEAYYSEDELIKSANGEFRTSLDRAVEWREEEAYFFRLSKFQKILLDLYNGSNFIEPNFRKNEVVAFVSGKSIRDLETESYKEGYLKDLSISRNNFSWGIKIPCDENGRELITNDDWIGGISKDEKHVIYVWLDALFNYQSAPHSLGKLEHFWNNAQVVHLVGKDILRFHAVYWPALLMAVEYRADEIDKIGIGEVLDKNILPATVFAHGWWTVEGKKMSKSVGNTINARDEAKTLISNYGLEEDVAIDYLRYYLATEMPFGADGDYSRARFVYRINSELVNNIGNLIQRVLVMVGSNCGGEIEKIEIRPDEKIKNLLTTGTMNKFDYLEYKNLMLDIATRANGHMEQTAPWNLKKENRIDEMVQVLRTEIEDIVKIAILLQVFCPHLAGKILDYFKITDRKFETIYNGRGFIAGQKLARPVGVFPRLERL
ncbi:methionine--tRNA ligase [Bacilli bacterium]|nr:methionine--tRNA ligase [Bacilli bacterium]